MTNVRSDHQLKRESYGKSKQELFWSDTNDSLASCITSKMNPLRNNETCACLVCGDRSSGRHYGQQTCEGCKSFFKRSIRRKFEYVCRNNKQCKINVEKRNQCQSCRFVKCLKVGMRKDAVQRTRSSKYQPDSTMESVQSDKISSRESKIVDTEWISDVLPDHNISIQDILESILEAENAAPIVNVDNFYSQSIHIVYSIVEWSKKLIYTDKISVTDNLLLLQNCWCQLFILNYSLCGLTSKLFYHTNSSTQSFLSVQSQLLALSRLPMDSVEYGCLKAIILFNPDTPLLFNSTLVDTAQETVQLALENHVKISSSNKSRFGRLLLRIPHLRSITTKDILEVFFNNTDESFTQSIHELFQKVLSVSKSKEDKKDLDYF